VGLIGSTCTTRPLHVAMHQHRHAGQTHRHLQHPAGAAGEGVYAVLVGGSNGDGAWRGLVTIVEFIDPRPYIFLSAVYGRLIYTVIYMSDRLLTQANPDPRLLAHPNCVGDARERPPQRAPRLRDKHILPATSSTRISITRLSR